MTQTSKTSLRSIELPHRYTVNTGRKVFTRAFEVRVNGVLVATIANFHFTGPGSSKSGYWVPTLVSGEECEWAKTKAAAVATVARIVANRSA